MKYLQKLLNETEVEWKPLGEVCKVLRGKRLTKRDLVQDGKYPIFHGGLEPIGYYSENNRLANSTMVINVGASAGTVGFCKHDFWSSDGCFCFSHNDTINQRYLFYALQSIEKTLKCNVRKAGIPTLDNKYIERVLIPIPCLENKKKSLEIQGNIVEILDKFTTLEAELEAELDCRKKQYEYYRNKLLYSDLSIVNPKTTDITYKTVGDIFDIRNGYTPSKANMDYWMEGSIPWFRMEDIRTNGSILNDSIQHITPHAIKGKGLFKANSIILATTATIGVHALLKVDSLANQRFTNFSVREALKDSILPEFLYYYFFVIDEWCKQNVYISSFPSVDMEKLNKQLVPIPSLSEQRRIVSILSKFDKLTTSISEGLPREIELRRKQYEYYRNKLLSFTNTKITQ